MEMNIDAMYGTCAEMRIDAMFVWLPSTVADQGLKTCSQRAPAHFLQLSRSLMICLIRYAFHSVIIIIIMAYRLISRD